MIKIKNHKERLVFFAVFIAHFYAFVQKTLKNAVFLTLYGTIFISNADGSRRKL